MKREVRITIRVTKEEKALLEQLAKMKGISQTDVLVELIRKEARRERIGKERTDEPSDR